MIVAVAVARILANSWGFKLLVADEIAKCSKIWENRDEQRLKELKHCLDNSTAQ